MVQVPKEVYDSIRSMETNISFDKFNMDEIISLAKAKYNLKYGKRLTEHQMFIYTASLYFFDYQVPNGVSDSLKVSAKRYTKFWK